MTRFLDGPAKGQVLALKRAARFLRVCEENGKWDALDQLEDSPKPGEKLYAYEITGKPGAAFVDGPKMRGCFMMAEYRLVPEQPTDAIMRNLATWHSWCWEMQKRNPRTDL